MISIHALREESDGTSRALYAFIVQFLSTPSARRATRPVSMGRSCSKFLSTPSARRATPFFAAALASVFYFYPRPPRGERRYRPATLIPSYRFLSTPSARRATDDRTGGTKHSKISIHALREESDGRCSDPAGRQCRFLSTPSARRATAKTERKHPAFVSLYTSLHKLQRDAYKTNRKITPLLAQTAGIPVRSVPENHVCCRFALAGHQKISTLSWANSGCSPTCSTLVW